MGNTLEEILSQFTKAVAYQQYNLFHGKYASNVPIKGIDDKSNPLTLAEPKLVFDKREMNGTPDNLYFDIKDGKIKMEYVFQVETTVKDTEPMVISDLSLTMHIKSEDGKETTENLTVYTLALRPQKAAGREEWTSVDEFVAIKKAIVRGDVYISWIGKVQWVDISSPEMQENLKKPDFRPQPQITTLKGTIPIKVVPNSASYTSMFGGVKGLKCWDSETKPSDDKLYFKDPFQNDILYILPQEYRIRALDDNSPDMTTEYVTENGTQKVLMRFRISPYIHPNAKRDAYDIFLRRQGKSYCTLEYGGYEDVRFDWGDEMKDGNLYGENGITSITTQGDIEATPDSNFFLVLKLPNDGLIPFFQNKLIHGGITVGNVFFKVKDGLDDKEIWLGPIKVILELHTLVGINTGVTITECEWPNYRARITNNGRYPIIIKGLALSVLRRAKAGLFNKKEVVKEAKHYLKCNAEESSTIKIELAQDESYMVELTSDQAERLKHKDLGLFLDKHYWTDFICEPYSIRLEDKALHELLGITNEGAATEHEQWKLLVMANFYWSDNPGLTAVQVRIRNSYGTDEVVTLSEGDEKKTISMVPNLNAVLNTQQYGDQKFEYCVKTIVKGRSSDSQWSDWASGAGDSLFIESYLLDLSK